MKYLIAVPLMIIGAIVGVALMLLTTAGMILTAPRMLLDHLWDSTVGKKKP